jgi:hypothetical protein
MHEQPAIFRRHHKRLGRRPHSGARWFEFGSVMMYAAASFRVTSVLPFGGRMGSRSGGTMTFVSKCPSALSLKGQRRLIFQPVDDLENHSAPEHFGLQISGVLFPVGGFPDAKPWFIAKIGKRIVGCESAAYTLVHHGQAVVRERLIVHRPLRKSRRWVEISDGFSNSHGDHQKVTSKMRQTGLIPGYARRGRPRSAHFDFLSLPFSLSREKAIGALVTRASDDTSTAAA